MPEKNICIHGHFYQPPRENPWLEEVEFESSALPYHDWNARITAECYAPNSVSRIMDSQWKIIGAVNNYSKISFNFGPTLLYWMETHEPELYNSILNADKESAKKYSGHGSAIAQVYNHMIMPLANKKDKQTQVIWGIRDFEARFGRYPEGIWLPETAVDIETLETLAENNIKFTLLSPEQALRIRKIGDIDWTDVKQGKIDTRRSYTCKLPSGKNVNLFFFDKFISSSASFGDMLSNGELFANRLMEGFKNSESLDKPIVNMATDGEVYGHHHIHGDMSLAYALYYIESKKLAQITNYAEFLGKSPPEYEVEIQENTSWSCSHGIERWRSDCGDNTGKPGWSQKWRKPLREAMNWLRDELAPKFELEAAKYLKDPWAARNAYVSLVLNRSKENAEKYLDEQKKKELDAEEKKRVLKLLEMQRQAMLMFTSCGWFFDEISGIETVQVMEYAARAMQLAEQVLGLNLEDGYLKFLENAPSNIKEFENGAKVYNTLVKKAIVNLEKIAAQATILQLFFDQAQTPQNSQKYGCCFNIFHKERETHDAGKFKMVISLSTVQSEITLDEATFACVAIWLGDHNVSCGVKLVEDEQLFKLIKNDILEKFNKGEINEAILLMPKHFGNYTYSLKDVLKDDQIRIISIIVKTAVEKATELNRIIFNDNSALLHFMSEINIPPSSPFRAAAETVINAEIKRLLESPEINEELLSKLIADSKTYSVKLEVDQISIEASRKIVKELQNVLNEPPDVKKLEALEKFIKTLQELPLNLELWQVQNVAFIVGEKIYNPMKEKQDDYSKAWVSAYQKLCKAIGIRLD